MIRNTLPLLVRFIYRSNLRSDCSLTSLKQQKKVLLHTSTCLRDSKFLSSKDMFTDNEDVLDNDTHFTPSKKFNIPSFVRKTAKPVDELFDDEDGSNYEFDDDRNYENNDNTSLKFMQDSDSSEWLDSLMNLKTTFDSASAKPFIKKLIEYNNDVDDDTKFRCKQFLKENDITLSGNSALHPALEFEDVKFNDIIANMLNRMDFKKPTAIQSVAWPQLMSGNNLVGIAQTGSGKTMGFVAPAIEHILQNERTEDPRVIIMCPTRELALQCSSVVHKLGRGGKIRHATIYGGESKERQIERLHNGIDLLVATPGRLLDLMNSGDISLNNCTFLVFDEADRMLDMGFKPQIDVISNRIRSDRQVAMWSATWPLEIQELANTIITKDYVHIKVGSGELTPSSTVAHFFKPFQSFTQKKSALVEMLNEIVEEETEAKVIVFTETKHTCDALDMYLRTEQFGSHIAIHGGKQQATRTTALKRFRENSRTNVLLATSVAARGLDIPEVKFVINFDMPMNAEEYVHRIGRAGRMGRQGYAVSYLSLENLRSGHFPKLINNLKIMIKNGGQEPPEDLDAILRASRRLSISSGTGSRHGQHRSNYRGSPKGRRY